MLIIQRHTEAVLNDHMLFHAISELSAAIGPFSTGNEANTLFSWHDEDGDLVAQASRHGLFIFDSTLPRAKRNQIAGACYFSGIPLFVEEELITMMEEECDALNEQEPPPVTADVGVQVENYASIVNLDQYRD